MQPNCEQPNYFSTKIAFRKICTSVKFVLGLYKKCDRFVVEKIKSTFIVSGLITALKSANYVEYFADEHWFPPILSIVLLKHRNNVVPLIIANVP